MKKIMIIASISFLIILFVSCAIKPSLIDHSFIYSTIKTEGIAILPVGGGQADRSVRQSAGLGFEKELAKKYPKVDIIGTQDTGNKLVKDDLIEKYAEVLSAYQMTGVIKPKKLDTIGKILMVRYLVIPIIQSYEKDKVKHGNKYTITLELQVWDITEKRVVFQIVTVGEDAPSGWMFDKQTLKVAAEKAGEIAAKAFPKPE